MGGAPRKELLHRHMGEPMDPADDTVVSPLSAVAPANVTLNRLVSQATWRVDVGGVRRERANGGDLAGG